MTQNSSVYLLIVIDGSLLLSGLTLEMLGDLLEDRLGHVDSLPLELMTMLAERLQARLQGTDDQLGHALTTVDDVTV